MRRGNRTSRTCSRRTVSSTHSTRRSRRWDRQPKGGWIRSSAGSTPITSASMKDRCSRWPRTTARGSCGSCCVPTRTSRAGCAGRGSRAGGSWAGACEASRVNSRLDVPRLKPGLVAVFIAALAGCRPAAGGVVLDFWGLGREGEVVAELMPAFERENPGIRVRVQQIPWTAAHEKLLTAYVGNATPDVAQLGNAWVPEFVALDGLVRLDSLVAASATVHPADYFSGIWSTNVLDGGVYGVPWYVDTRLLFYRKDLLARAGFPNPPTSWREWLAAMRTMKAQGGPDRYPIFIPTNEWPPPTILGLQAGSPILRDGARYGAFTEPPFRRALGFYLDLYRTGLAPRLGINDVGNIYQEFARGTFAMWITGPWNIGEFRRRTPPDFQDKWGTAPLPGPEGAASGVSLAGGSSLVVFHASRQRGGARLLGAAAAGGADAAGPRVGADRYPGVRLRRAGNPGRGARGHGARPARRRGGPHPRTAPLAARPSRRAVTVERAGARAAWLFLAPALAVIGVFFFVPVVASLALSFTDFDLYAIADPRNARFVWLHNYAALLHTPVFWTALKNTVYFVAVGAPLSVLVSLATAL